MLSAGNAFLMYVFNVVRLILSLLVRVVELLPSVISSVFHILESLRYAISNFVFPAFIQFMYDYVPLCIGYIRLFFQNFGLKFIYILETLAGVIFELLTLLPSLGRYIFYCLLSIMDIIWNTTQSMFPFIEYLLTLLPSLGRFILYCLSSIKGFIWNTTQSIFPFIEYLLTLLPSLGRYIFYCLLSITDIILNTSRSMFPVLEYCFQTLIWMTAFVLIGLQDVISMAGNILVSIVGAITNFFTGSFDFLLNEFRHGEIRNGIKTELSALRKFMDSPEWEEFQLGCISNVKTVLIVSIAFLLMCLVAAILNRKSPTVAQQRYVPTSAPTGRAVFVEPRGTSSLTNRRAPVVQHRNSSSVDDVSTRRAVFYEPQGVSSTVWTQRGATINNATGRIIFDVPLNRASIVSANTFATDIQPGLPTSVNNVPPAFREPRSAKEPEKKPQKISLGLCIICEDREKSIVMVPCGHLSLCANCSLTLRKYDGLCPICRKVVQRTYPVFVS